MAAPTTQTIQAVSPGNPECTTQTNFFSRYREFLRSTDTAIITIPIESLESLLAVTSIAKVANPLLSGLIRFYMCII